MECAVSIHILKTKKPYTTVVTICVLQGKVRAITYIPFLSLSLHLERRKKTKTQQQSKTPVLLYSLFH